MLKNLLHSVPNPDVKENKNQPFPKDALWNVDLSRVTHAPEGFEYEIALDGFFNARHSVISDGTRGKIHAHSYRLTVVFRARILRGKEAFTLPYHLLRRRLKTVMLAYNNQYLNDLPPFSNIEPTTEALSAVIYQQMENLCQDLPIEIIRVTLYESPTESVTFQKSHRR